MLIYIKNIIYFINKATNKLLNKANLFKDREKQILNNITNLFNLIYIFVKSFKTLKNNFIFLIYLINIIYTNLKVLVI